MTRTCGGVRRPCKRKRASPPGPGCPPASPRALASLPGARRVSPDDRAPRLRYTEFAGSSAHPTPTSKEGPA
ncbi:hypothetical protein C7S17_1127 [Burkholderia thailandensis]|nr:hypothetical protein [Burkholderia thailandensis]